MSDLMGLEVEDKITGFKGLVIGHTTCLTGCDQYLVSPKVDEKGALVDSVWFDDIRLKQCSAMGPVVFEQTSTPGGDKPAPRK